MTTVVHCKREKFDVYIGRPSKWGNPCVIKSSTVPFTMASLVGDGADFIVVDSREEAIQGYEVYLSMHPELVADAKRELKGKVLGCWCKPKSCHGDILARVAEEP